MKTFIKLIVTLLVLLVAGYFVVGFYNSTIGNYASSNLLNYGFMIVGIIVLVVAVIYGLRKLWMLSTIIFMFMILESCSHAKSNQQVVVSEDCGSTWKQIANGNAVPKGGINTCYMKVVMPNFNLQGETKFKVNLKDKVKGEIQMDYDYSITNALSLIKSAKYLGTANADVNSDEALDPVKFEVAENVLIEKQIREIAGAVLLSEDVVDMDIAEIEAVIQEKSNKALEQFGVKLNSIFIAFDPDEHTREAIDIATAMKIYESKGLTELGKQVIIQRAGANRTNVINNIPPNTAAPADK
jgi:hypothetical protein